MTRANKSLKVVSYVSHPTFGFETIWFVFEKKNGSQIFSGSKKFSTRREACLFRNELFENYGFKMKNIVSRKI